MIEVKTKTSEQTKIFENALSGQKGRVSLTITVSDCERKTPFKRIFENFCLLEFYSKTNLFFISAQQLKLNDDRLTITGDKGYCSVRSTHCKFLYSSKFFFSNN